MTLDPFRFIWRQLRGPQISAIIQAVMDWCIKEFSAFIEYWGTLRLDTANTEHLTTIGTLSGFPRAIVSIPNDKMFWFTDGPYHNSEHGYSDLHEFDEIAAYSTFTPTAHLTGGKFSDLEEDRIAATSSRLPPEVFREIYKVYVNSDGIEGSLVLLDDITYKAWMIYQTQRLPMYYIEIIPRDTGVRNAGDLVVHLGSLRYWEDGQLIINSIYRTIEKALYLPDPKIFIDMTEDGQFLETEDGKEYLQFENGDRIQVEVYW